MSNDKIYDTTSRLNDETSRVHDERERREIIQRIKSAGLEVLKIITDATEKAKKKY